MVRRRILRRLLLVVPDADATELNGPAPDLSLAYSSPAVDGQSEATNNQPSWIGEGFEYWPGFIEREYKSCADDMGGTANNTSETGDQCWGTDNAHCRSTARQAS